MLRESPNAHDRICWIRHVIIFWMVILEVGKTVSKFGSQLENVSPKKFNLEILELGSGPAQPTLNNQQEAFLTF